MTTRQTSAAAPTTPATHNTNSSALSQGAMPSSSLTVTNRQTADQKRARYRQDRNLPAYQRETNIKKVKIEKQGGAADIQQAPKPDGSWDKFKEDVATDGVMILAGLGSREFIELAAWLRTSPGCLLEIIICNCRMYDADAVFLADALKGNTTLTTLNLYHNRISVEGARAVVKALKDNASVTTLKINKNKILTMLERSSNTINTKRIFPLAEAFRGNTNLTTLNLCGNTIGDAGAIALAELLKINTTLTTLDLRLNEIGEKGVAVLAEALNINTTLTTLDLSLGRSSEFGQKIDDLLERNRQRKKLLPDAEGGLHLFVRHSPVLGDMFVPKDVVPVLTQHLSNDVLAFFAKEWEKTMPASVPSITTTNSNSTTITTTTTTTTTSDSTT